MTRSSPKLNGQGFYKNELDYSEFCSGYIWFPNGKLYATVSRIGKSHMKTVFFQLWFLKKKIWSKYTLGIVVSWYNLRNCNIWLFLWHLSPQSGPFHQFWSFLLILFSKTTQKKSKHYSGRAFLEVFGKCVGLGLSSSIQRPQKC